MFFFAIDQLESAQAAFDAGRLVEARVQLESSRASGPSAALLARIYQQLKLPERAAAAATQAGQMGASIPAVQHNLALYYAAAGKRDLAALWEGRYARSSQADPAASLRAALLYSEIGNHAQAITFGLTALEKQDRPELRLLLARAYESKGRSDDAIVQYRALLKLLPYDEATHAAAAQAFLRMARFNDANELLAESRKTFEKSSQIELAYGVALYTQRRFPEAATSFFRVIQLDGAVPQPYIFLARMIDQIPERVGELRAAAEAWLKVEANNGFAPFVLARALHASGGSDDQLLSLLNEAIRRDASVWEFPFELAQLHERQRDFTSAAAQYEKAITLNPKVPEPHYRLARVYDRLNKPELAARERKLHQALQGTNKGGMQ